MSRDVGLAVLRPKDGPSKLKWMVTSSKLFIFKIMFFSSFGHAWPMELKLEILIELLCSPLLEIFSWGSTEETSWQGLMWENLGREWQYPVASLAESVILLYFFSGMWPSFNFFPLPSRISPYPQKQRTPSIVSTVV